MAELICGDCHPNPARVGEVTQSIWLCPEHKAKHDELMAKIGPHLQFRKCRCEDGPPCDRPGAHDGLCSYCVRMYPCDHATQRIVEG